jgi:hypothetical protein
LITILAELAVLVFALAVAALWWAVPPLRQRLARRRKRGDTMRPS